VLDLDTEGVRTARLHATATESGADGQIYFGQNLTPRFRNTGTVTINLGDQVDVE
jgi:hypothetical protein